MAEIKYRPWGEYTVEVLYTLLSVASRSGIEPVENSISVQVDNRSEHEEPTANKPNTSFFGSL